MYVIFLQCTYCVQKSLTVSCMLLCECGDRVKVDQSSFSADLHAVMLRHTARSVVLSVVSSGYRIRFTGPSLLLETPRENTISPGPQKVQGMREQISLMLQKNAIMKVPQDSIKSFPCMQSVRRVTSSNIFKTTERSHLYTSLSIEYCRKRRLCVQNKSAGCILSCNNTSRQGLSVTSTSLRSEHCPSDIYLSGVHSDCLPPSSGDISYPISQ